ncbi:MAG: hypothetical protein EHM56_04390 [Chloroflexi bacterium]|nr:MAG: hypothetical protein EHM56_04390 [Chloroflexota bacterium]
MAGEKAEEQAAGNEDASQKAEERGREADAAQPPAGGGVPQYVTHIQSAQGTINIGPTLNLGSPGAAHAERAAEEWTGTPYDVGVIRRLLLAAFTPQDLARFCQDEEPFRPVVAYFGPGQGLVDMVDRLVDYCRTHALWDELLAAIRRTNPAQYERFAAQLGAGAGRRRQAERLVALQQRARSLAAAPRRQEALARVDALRQALFEPRPDLALLESTWRWFRAEMPPLSGPVLSAILAAGREIQAGDDDELWAEFQDRFGELAP